MSGPLDEAIATVVRLIADKTGLAFKVEDIEAIAQRGATLLTELVDTHAKAHAAAAGQASSDAITTEAQAEATQRKP